MSTTKKNNQQKMIRTQVFLKPDQKNRLARIAQRSNIKSSEILRRGLEEFLDKYEQQQEENWLTGFENFSGISSNPERKKEFEQDVKNARGGLDKRSFFPAA
jgi:hypothetical protein